MLWSYEKCQKSGGGKVLAPVSTKYLLAQTIPDKIFGTKWRNPVKLDRKTNSGICYCVFFNCY